MGKKINLLLLLIMGYF